MDKDSMKDRVISNSFDLIMSAPTMGSEGQPRPCPTSQDSREADGFSAVSSSDPALLPYEVGEEGLWNSAGGRTEFESWFSVTAVDSGKTNQSVPGRSSVQ